MRFSFLSSTSSVASSSPWFWGISFLMSLPNSEYVISWARRSLIPNMIVIFTRSEAVALAPKSRILGGGGTASGGSPVAGSVGATPLSDCGDQFGFTRQRCWGDLGFTVSSSFALALQLTYLDCASGAKRLLATPIFSGPGHGRHYCLCTASIRR